MVEIRQVIDPAEFKAVSRFRYSIYVEEMNRKQKHADHEQKTIVDPLDTEGACNLAATAGSTATVTNLGSNLQHGQAGSINF